MKRTLSLVVLLVCAEMVFAQAISSQVLNKKWNAWWLTSDDGGEAYGVYHFRKKITLSVKPSSFIVHVSGDNRYKLFVNGQLASLGPARGDLYHWNFETVDLAPFLKQGENVLAAVVWNFGKERALAQISYRTGFVLQGNTEAEEMANTNTSWKYLNSKSYSPLKPDLTYTYYALGPGEHVDMNAFPLGWESLEYNDSQWQQPKTISQALPKGVFDWFYNWMLVPRTIPPMELTPQRFQRLREVSGVQLPNSFPAIQSSIQIPAHSKVNMLLDQSFLTNAYPVLNFSKGRNAEISLQYAEALFIDEGNAKHWKAQNSKGNRNEVAGKRFVGVKDQITSNGNSNQTYTTLDWRTFRYLRLQVETGDEPLIIDDISSVFSGYPFKLTARFMSADSALEKILETGWRTARLCAGETYVDCPYYEQLQYFGDTRIQCMISLYNSGDDRLVRNAIRQADYSRVPEGMTLSRYPSSLDQQIPTFSLWWIGMLHDYLRYKGDPDFVKSFLNGERGVLQFFSRYQKADGRLKNAPYWEFSDWSEGGGWNSGVPPIGEDGSSAVLDFQLLLAYQTAARLENEIGLKELANNYSMAATKLTDAIKAAYWDESKKLFADTKEKKYFSQHANSLAILTETVKGADATELMKKILSDESLTKATIYFNYYVNQALAKANLGDLYLDQLGVWKENLKMGMTTWAEISDIDHARSDCHAWGASPNIELYRIVLGIDSDGTGFKNIRIEPHLGALKEASGSIPHPNGKIEVSYKSEKNSWKVEIKIPEGTTGQLVWKGKNIQLEPGTTAITL
ncbi:MAG: alpha-rhamnosidase [Bacteroidetes bacterium]|nr:alpha-rhamnosidase [Bacteroidota bacterium]